MTREEKAYDIEEEGDFELTLTLKADLSPAVPQSWDYPGDPASIEDLLILIEGEEVGWALQDKILDKFKDEIEELIWDRAREDKEEFLISQAEYRRDALEDR